MYTQAHQNITQYSSTCLYCAMTSSEILKTFRDDQICDVPWCIIQIDVIYNPFTEQVYTSRWWENFNYSSQDTFFPSLMNDVNEAKRTNQIKCLQTQNMTRYLLILYINQNARHPLDCSIYVYCRNVSLIIQFNLYI